MNEMKEIWKRIGGLNPYAYPFNYAASSLGRIGKVENNTIIKILPQHKNKNGYLYIRIIGKQCRVNRMVAEAFWRNEYPEENPCELILLHAHHKNGIKTDNKIENLEWLTREKHRRLKHGI